MVAAGRRLIVAPAQRREPRAPARSRVPPRLALPRTPADELTQRRRQRRGLSDATDHRSPASHHPRGHGRRDLRLALPDVSARGQSAGVGTALDPSWPVAPWTVIPRPPSPRPDTSRPADVPIGSCRLRLAGSKDPGPPYFALAASNVLDPPVLVNLASRPTSSRSCWPRMTLQSVGINYLENPDPAPALVRAISRGHYLLIAPAFPSGSRVLDRLPAHSAQYPLSLAARRHTTASCRSSASLSSRRCRAFAAPCGPRHRLVRTCSRGALNLPRHHRSSVPKPYCPATAPPAARESR